MKTILLVLAALGSAAAAPLSLADPVDPCDFALVNVPRNPSSSEPIGLRLSGGVFGPGAGPAVARATLHSGIIDLDVVLTRDRDAFPGYQPVGDVTLDVLSWVGPLRAGVYPVRISTRSFVDGVTNVPCNSTTQTLAVGTASGSVVHVDVVEYYHAGLDRHMLGTVGAHSSGDWAPTGRSFKAYAPSSSDGRGRLVIRYFYYPLGQDVVFFTGSPREAADLLRFFPGWTFQFAPFEIPYPDTLTGGCPGGTTPVYRVVNPRNGDHRWITDRFLQVDLLSRGWIAEGYGDVGVAMCSPLA